MMNNLTPFQEAALDFKNHITLTANAGSGKTFVLSERYLNIALNANVHLSKIVAITFTDKAAGELYKKISETVTRKIEAERNEKLREKLIRIKRQLVSANISTIHSFCISILREYSPDAGIDANFSPIDALTANELISKSIEDALNKTIVNEEKSDDLKFLLRVAGSKNALARQLKKLVDNRKKIESLKEKVYSKPEDEIAEYLRGEFDKYYNLLFKNKVEAVIPAIEKILEASQQCNPGNEFAASALNLMPQLSAEKSAARKLKILLEILSKICTKTNVRKTKFLSKEQRSELADEISLVEDLVSELNSFSIDAVPERREYDLAVYGKKIISLLEPVLEIYMQMKSEKGYLDFEDILLFTKNLLSNEDVRTKLQEKYNYIMIDEYQDTNEIQYKIFMPILEYLNVGNLFVVGDEKQSIYRFRDADLEVFDRTKREIIQKSGEGNIKKLPHSFRLSPQIALFTNYVFKKIFAAPNPLFNEVEYNELICANYEDKNGRIEFLIAGEETVQTESELAADRILELVYSENDLKFGDFGVLCRKRNSFFRLEEEFTKKKIPYKIIGGKGFFQRQIIYDIYLYLSFLLNPYDDISLVGILRSPFYSINDAELFNISVEKGNSFLSKMKSYSAGNTKIRRIIDLLNSHIALSKTEDYHTLIRKILFDTGLWLSISARKNREQELSNVEKLISMAADYSRQSFTTLYDFVEKLKDAIVKIEDESQAPISAAENAVNILTVHQSKGLEFKAVVFFETNSVQIRSSVSKRGLAIDKEFGLLTKLPSEGNYFGAFAQAPINNIFNYLNSKRESAEAKRLLYVAVTRAVKYLIITGTTKKGKPDKNSFLQMFFDSLDYDGSAEEVTFADKLTYMKSAEDDYEIFSQSEKLTIPFKRFVEVQKSVDFENREKVGIGKYFLDEKKFTERNEVLSASKLNVFIQCPLKYKLIYELGFQKLINLFSPVSQLSDEKFLDGEESEIPADMRGRIIHKVLEEQVDRKELPKVISNLLDKEIIVSEKNNFDKSGAQSEIFNLISEFYNSEIYDELFSYDNYFNEYEIYLNEGDVFLYGIIDKLIIDDSKIIIADFKTDILTEKNEKLKIENYVNQLKFYAFIVGRKFGFEKEITIELIFLRQPEKPFKRRLPQKELLEFGDKIKFYLERMRGNKFEKNESHCPRCQFFVGGKCLAG